MFNRVGEGWGWGGGVWVVKVEEGGCRRKEGGWRRGDVDVNRVTEGWGGGGGEMALSQH